MPHFASLDISLGETAICVIDADGVIIEERKVATERKDVVAALRGPRRRYCVVVLEAGALANRLHAALVEARLPAICIETRHAHRILKARMNKTDRNDALGLADLARVGMYRPVHVKSMEGQLARTLLTACENVQHQRVNLENGLRGLLRPYWMRLGKLSGPGLEERARHLTRLAPALGLSVDAMLRAREALRSEFERLDRAVIVAAAADPACRLLMTAPDMGPLTALAYRWTIDDPHRFAQSKSVGAFLGLTRRAKASGEHDPNTGISKWGDRITQTALVRAASHFLIAHNKPNQFQPWARAISVRRGAKRAMVAGARKLAVVLHRIWVTEAEFQLRA